MNCCTSMQSKAVFLGLSALWQSWRVAGEDQGPKLMGNPYVQALLTQMGNPKAILFFGALVPQFLDTAAALVPQYLIMYAVTFVGESLILSGYGALAAWGGWFIYRTSFALDGRRFFTIESTHSGVTTLNANNGGDTINVTTTSTGTTTINAGSGADTVNVAGAGGLLFVNGGDDNDTVNVGSDAPLLPSVPTNKVGTTDAMNALLTVNGGNGADTMNVDDSDPALTNKSGTLTSWQLSDERYEKDETKGFM